MEVKVFHSAYFRQYACVILATLNMIGAGMDLTWSSPVLVKLQDANSTVVSRPITEEEGSWIVSAMLVPYFFLYFLFTPMVDRIGRKYSIILSIIPRTLAYVVFIFGSKVWMVIMGRILQGAADFFTLGAMPMYLTEIASKEIRGSVAMGLQLATVSGMVLMYSVGPFMSYEHLNVLGLVTTVVLSVPLYFLPDSPIFLYKKGRKDEALKALKFFQASDQKAMEELNQYEKCTPKRKTKIKTLLKNKVILKTLGLVAVYCTLLVLTGHSAVMYYLQPILVATNTNISSEIASVIISVMQLASSIVTALVVDKFGRRPILIVTVIGIFIGKISLGTYFKLLETENPVLKSLNWMPITSLVLAICSYSAGCGSISMWYMSELFDDQGRALGMSFVMGISGLGVFLSSLFLAPLMRILGASTVFWACSVFTLILCVFVYFCMPETKNRSFEDIQIEMGKKCEDMPKDSLK
ncbi:unnamed protein product [Plutella xylostella]|uniref:(diamondback moth) hypothetical protein n=1 Tax=Plutella xylostella TaxID=51655 RepID=A0A8S4EU14_PLUXY|nr:unnamed protein product [Plutella xylostella]